MGRILNKSPPVRKLVRVKPCFACAKRRKWLKSLFKRKGVKK